MTDRLLAYLFAAGVASLSLAGSARAFELVLQNGWTNAPFGTSNAEAFYGDGMVHFKGGIAGGSSAVAFTLPPAFQGAPGPDVYLPIDLCGAHPGRLVIQSNGVVSVESSTTFADAQCFTSLDGAMFVLGGAFTALPLSNTWVAGLGTNTPGASLGNGIVRLRGTIYLGTDPLIFTLPLGMRPATDVYVPVSLCNGRKGRLYIQPNGEVRVFGAVSFADAQCMTSLEGVSFAQSPAGFTPLTPLNGWTNAPYATSDAAVALIDGVVHLKGGLFGGAANLLFTLPPALSPLTDVYVAIDLCGGKAGRLYIQANGQVSVYAEGSFSDAQCFTSLDGARFVAPTPKGFTDLTLLNTWFNDSPSTPAAVELSDWIVRFKGRIAYGWANPLTVLPLTMRPDSNVYLAVDVCNMPGRLRIEPDGDVIVSPSPWNYGGTCPVSLEGASFAPSPIGFTELALLNDWGNDPFFGASNASARLIDGIVHLRGAVSNGSPGLLFTLPAGMRPATDVYLLVNLCVAYKGRLLVQPNGDVTVSALGSFPEAQCMTSLDGVKFAPSASGFTPATLQNGWSGAPYSTSDAAFAMKNKKGFVYLEGAIAGGSNELVFTLPEPLRPEGDAYVPIDLCNAEKGRLRIESNGNVNVEAQGSFSDAQCFSSLDGAAFFIPEPGESALFSCLLLLGGLGRRRARRVAALSARS